MICCQSLFVKGIRTDAAPRTPTGIPRETASRKESK